VPLRHSASAWQGTPAVRGGRGEPAGAAQTELPETSVQIPSVPQTAGSAAQDRRQVPLLDDAS